MTSDLFAYFDAAREGFLAELAEFLAIASISTRREAAGDVARAAQWVAGQLRAAGLAAEVHQTPGHPLVLAQSPQIAGRPTVLVYGHYDVQPPEPLARWTCPPFSPTVREGKIYARGAADDKGQVFIYLKVLEAFQRVRGALPVNVKVLVEGEEEIGSPHLLPWITARRAQLACDVILVSDTHMHSARQPSITTGLRGLTCLEVKVKTARADLHSGSYGGAVANPIQVLAELLAACKNAKTGKVKIPGFYRDVQPLSAAERRALVTVPHRDAAFRRDVGAKALFGERGYSTLAQIGARPTFEVNGIWGGYSGEGIKTVLPAEAQAKISLRLVPRQHPETIGRLVARYLKQIAPPHAQVTVRRERNQGHPVRIAPTFPAMRLAQEAIAEVFGVPPVFLLEGGSIPVVADFARVLGRQAILLGFGLPDDNCHAPDENFDLTMLDRGMKTVALLWEKLGR